MERLTLRQIQGRTDLPHRRREQDIDCRRWQRIVFAVEDCGHEQVVHPLDAPIRRPCDHEPAATSRERAHILGRLRTCFEHDMKRRVRRAPRGLDGRLYHRVADVQRFALADVARVADARDKALAISLRQGGRRLHLICDTARLLLADIRDASTVEVALCDQVDVAIQSLELRRQTALIARQHLSDRVVEPSLDQPRRTLLNLVERAAPALHRVAKVLQVGRHVIDGAGASVDDTQLLFEIHAHARDERFRRRVRRLVEHRVGGVEDLAEEVELLGKDVEREALRNVAGCQEADDGDAALLAVPVDAADALLDALRVPRQVVVDDRVAELEVQALGAGFG